MPMNKGLQKHNLEEALKKRGIHDFDVEAHIDPTLSYKENLTKVSNELGITLRKQRFDLDASQSLEDRGNQRIAKDHVKDIIEEEGWKNVIDLLQSGENKTLNDIKGEYGEDFILSIIHHDYCIDRKTILSEVFNIKQTIQELVSDKSDYRSALDSILEYEEENLQEVSEEEVEGWRHKDVGVNPGRLALLASKGIIEPVVENNEATFYKLVDPETTREALGTSGSQEEDSNTQVDGAELVDRVSGIDPSEEEIQEFKKIVEENDALEYWKDYVNPKLEKMDDAKKAVLVSLASVKDAHGDRGRIHVLLHGDEGTGKSALSKWVSNELGHDHVSNRTTEVGLTGDMRGDEITAGALPKAHGGHLIIEETDEFSKGDRGGLLTAMSEGVVKMDGGGKSAELKAETSCIATANRIDDWRPELIDRFDFTIELEKPRKEEGAEIVKGRVDSFMRDKKDYDGKKLKKFLNWVKEHDPEIDDTTREEIKEILDQYIQKRDKDHVQVRQYERFLRIGLAIARLNHRDLQTEDVIRAIEMTTGDVMLGANMSGF